MSRCHAMNISTWIQRGGNTLYEYLGTCTCKIQYFAMYHIYSGGERSPGDSDRYYLMREVCTHARTTLHLPKTCRSQSTEMR
jgi:hypothetical protein